MGLDSKEIRAEVERVVKKMKLKDDREYFRRQIRNYPTEYWLKILKGYIEQWKQGVQDEKVLYRKQNAGRYKANVWLRETNHWE